MLGWGLQKHFLESYAEEPVNGYVNFLADEDLL